MTVPLPPREAPVFFLGLEKIQSKTNTAFRSIDNGRGRLGESAAHSSPFQRIFLGDSALNVITGGNNSLPCAEGSRLLTAGMDSNAPKFSLLLWESR